MKGDEERKKVCYESAWEYMGKYYGREKNIPLCLKVMGDIMRRDKNGKVTVDGRVMDIHKVE